MKNRYSNDKEILPIWKLLDTMRGLPGLEGTHKSLAYIYVQKHWTFPKEEENRQTLQLIAYDGKKEWRQLYILSWGGMRQGATQTQWTPLYRYPERTSITHSGDQAVLIEHQWCALYMTLTLKSINKMLPLLSAWVCRHGFVGTDIKAGKTSKHSN